MSQCDEIAYLKRKLAYLEKLTLGIFLQHELVLQNTSHIFGETHPDYVATLHNLNQVDVHPEYDFGNMADSYSLQPAEYEQFNGQWKRNSIISTGTILHNNCIPIVTSAATRPQKKSFVTVRVMPAISEM